MIVAAVYWALIILIPYIFLQNPYGFGYYLISKTEKMFSSISPGMYLHWCWTVIERFERFREEYSFVSFKITSFDIVNDQS